MGRGGGTRKATDGKKFFIVLGLLPFAALAAAFAAPYLSAVARGASGAAAAFGDPALLKTAAFTVAQAAASTAAALALGVPGAWLLASSRSKTASAVRALAVIPFAMPPILVVLGFVLFFGNAGWLNRLLGALTGNPEPTFRLLYSPKAIVLAHAFYNFPVVLVLVGDAFRRGRESYAHAAASLGASPFRLFRSVLLPLAAPSIAAAGLLVFLYCFTSFAVVLVLGGGPAATTLSVEIYRAARISLDFEGAGALALVETAIAAAAYAAYLIVERRSRVLSGKASAGDRPRALYEPPPRRWAAGKLARGLYFAAAGLLVLGPLLSIAVESVLARASRAGIPAPSLRWWAALADAALPALGRSLVLAALAATLCTILAAAAATAVWGVRSYAGGRKGDAYAWTLSSFCALPVASSGIVLGFGWLNLYGSGFGRSLWAVALVHAVAALPFAYRAVAEGFAGLPVRLSDSSATLGAKPWATALRIALPGTLPRLRSAWAFAAAVSLGELNAVLMLGLDDYQTLPLLVYRAAGSYRFGAACAAGVLLMAACAAAMYVSGLGEDRRGAED